VATGEKTRLTNKTVLEIITERNGLRPKETTTEDESAATQRIERIRKGLKKHNTVGSRQEV